MQAFLTSVIETIVIVGFSSIVAHAFYASTKKWSDTYCPPVKPYNPEEKIEKAVEKTEKVEPKVEEIIPVMETPLPTLKPSVDYSKMTLKELVAICKADSTKYAGYTTIQKKEGKTGLVAWMEAI